MTVSSALLPNLATTNPIESALRPRIWGRCPPGVNHSHLELYPASETMNAPIHMNAITRPRPGDEGLNSAPGSPILITLKC